jgi:hypothetical protein
MNVFLILWWRERDWMIYVIVSKMGDIPSNA